MDWKGINLHIEHLIPGVVLTAELARISNLPNQLIFSTPIERATTFVALSYMVGVLSATLSRAVLDAISEFGPRALVFRALAHHERAALEASLGSDAGFVADLRVRRWHELKPAHPWNAVYRAILRSVLARASDKARDEIYRRREQARLVRNLFLPTVLSAFLLDMSGPQLTLAVVGVSLFAIFLYAYAELNIFAEAADIYWSQPSPKVFPSSEGPANR